MARATTIVTNSFQQIASGSAVITVKTKGRGSLIFNETATESNANFEHPEAGAQFLQNQAGKTLFVKAAQADAGWVVLTDGDI